MNSRVHRAETRGFADHGWLTSYHSFSFGNYNNPDRMGFGLLRVINDDIVKPSMGFGTHPHKDMEIISIPLSGTLQHRDSMGHQHVINSGEVQLLSAGAGITHSEYNHSDQQDVNFLQIWIHPREKGAQPRYEQKSFDPQDQLNRFQVLISPLPSDHSLRINQDAWLSMAQLDPGRQIGYELQQKTNGLYLFVVEGEIVVEGEMLNRRDAIAFEDIANIQMTAQSHARVLCIEVPMAQALH